MPKIKMKTKSGVKKRFSLTAKGRIKRKHAYLRHILTPKRTKNKRKLRRGGYIAKTQEHQIKAMLPFKPTDAQKRVIRHNTIKGLAIEDAEHNLKQLRTRMAVLETNLRKCDQQPEGEVA